MATSAGEHAGGVLVTGVSSGLGLEIAVHLASCGFKVVGTMRNLARRAAIDQEAARRGARLVVTQLDVTDPASVRRAVDEAVRETGSLRAVINNAGVQVRGYFEDLGADEIRGVFETNVFGAMAVTRAALPHLRQMGRGRIIFISSIAARLAAPALTAYCASKAALGGFAEALALEVQPFGIGVSLVEPGIVRTPIWESNRNVARAASGPDSPYRAWFAGTERLADAVVQTAPTTAADVARVVERALRAKHPRLRYVVGWRASLLVTLKRLLPAEIFERIYMAVVTRQIAPSPHE